MQPNSYLKLRLIVSRISQKYFLESIQCGIYDLLIIYVKFLYYYQHNIPFITLYSIIFGKYLIITTSL